MPTEVGKQVVLLSQNLVIADGDVNLYAFFWKLMDFTKEVEDVQILQGCQGCSVPAQEKHNHTYTRSPTQPGPKPYVPKEKPANSTNTLPRRKEKLT